ncbi:MAG: exopolysaccharide biosynthesis protein [Loktanella sp.]|nr:exopolysaccharide biosynthesis protein [Loktanella sp.]
MTDAGSGDNSHQEIGEIVETLREVGEDKSPTVRDIVEQLGSASFGAMLLVPAMVIASPASGIPVLPTICGLIIALISIQMVFGRDHIWLPDWLMTRKLDQDRFDRMLHFVRKPVRWVDRVTRPRLTWLLRWPAVLPLQVLCVLCGLAMPVMELVPLTSSIAAFAVCLVAVSLMSDDGFFALAGVVVAIGGAVVFSSLARGVISSVFG